MNLANSQDLIETDDEAVSMSIVRFVAAPVDLSVASDGPVQSIVAFHFWTREAY
jgi:hypothetical protein